MSQTSKVQKAAGQGSQKHLNSRISFLYKATTYLNSVHSQSLSPRLFAQVRGTNGETGLEKEKEPIIDTDETSLGQDDLTENINSKAPADSLQLLGLGRQFLDHAQGISKKSQIRLSQTMKRSVCKKCNSFLDPGSSASSRMENSSRGGKKPWADILVVTCNYCGTAKRYPVGAKRQLKKSKRKCQTQEKSE
ncbi:MAG: hypothetical protein LQ342_002820 [Letrouitia transgressa]|nr:MAG: hypothetical protein LQ342_002820 [Letrouitia transgressa]